MNHLTSKTFNLVTAILVCGVLLSACRASKQSLAVNNEKFVMDITEKSDVINYALLQRQSVPSLASRGSRPSSERGLPIPGLVGGAVSLATNAVKQMIANDQKKYTAEYKYALTDLYFYDQLSTHSPFDPIGMQFNGFRLVRTFDNDGKIDTAMIADFELDSSNPYEIINNSIFRLKLKDISVNYAKAKVAAGGDITLNVDFEITFNSSYVNGDGELFKNVELGKFYFLLRGAPLDKSDENYESFYEKQKGKKLDGFSFIVPRSFGYHVTGMNSTEQAFSQGAYSINVKVKESSKNSFVNELIIDNSGKLIDQLGDQIKKQFK